jgi:hypothetical protein
VINPTAASARDVIQWRTLADGITMTIIRMQALIGWLSDVNAMQL